MFPGLCLFPSFGMEQTGTKSQPLKSSMLSYVWKGMHVCDKSLAVALGLANAWPPGHVKFEDWQGVQLNAYSSCSGSVYDCTWNWLMHNDRTKRPWKTVVCKTIRFYSLFAAGDVLRGRAAATQWQKFHTDDVKSVWNPVRSTDWSTLSRYIV